MWTPNCGGFFYPGDYYPHQEASLADNDVIDRAFVRSTSGQWSILNNSLIKEKVLRDCGLTQSAKHTVLSRIKDFFCHWALVMAKKTDV